MYGFDAGFEARPDAKAGYARPALHIAVPHDPSDQATKPDARESHPKPRDAAIIFITTFDLFCARPRAERTRRA